MKKIKIGINTLPLFDTMAGAERYAQNVIKALSKLDKINEYVLFLNCFNKDSYSIYQDNFKNLVCNFPKNKIARVFYEQFILPRLAEKENIDVLFSTCNIAPIRTKCALVTMIFDLHWLRYPQFFNTIKNFYLNKMLDATAKKSARILTLSESSKKDIVDIFKINPEKISVTYCGSDNIYHDDTDERLFKKQQQKGASGDKYILFVGQFHKRKNIPLLIRSFEKVKKELNIPHKLYLVGRPGDGFNEVVKLYNKSAYKNDIKIMGYLLDENLTLLYNNADIFIYPSLYEGFGLPIVEAFANKVPVISSYASSLPEVGADGALYFNPQNEDELAEKIKILIKNEKLKKELVAKGLKQAEKFTWEKVAQTTLETIEKVVYNGIKP